MRRRARVRVRAAARVGLSLNDVTAAVEDAGTDLWDLSADPSIARFLMGCLGHGEVFVALISLTPCGRLAEIALGTLANIVATPALGLAIGEQAPSLTYVRVPRLQQMSRGILISQFLFAPSFPSPLLL